MNQFTTDLRLAQRAGVPIIFVVSEEIATVAFLIGREFMDAGVITQREQVRIWSVTDGWDGDKRNDPTEVPTIIEEFPPRTICILQNFHWYLGENASPTLVQAFIDGYSLWKDLSPRTIIIVSPFYKIAPELDRLVHVVTHPMASSDELTKVLKNILEDNDNKQNVAPLTEEEISLIVRAGMGLTRGEFETAVSMSIMGSDEFRPSSESVMKTKTEIITKSGYLEFWPYNDDLSSVGGMNNLKDWLKKREKGLTLQAREFGLPYPKGILLLGCPGTGKSLLAKCVAKQWGLPLVRFDLGKVFTSLVGESEQRMRTILRLIEALAPVIVWVDEIEKGLAGAKSVTSTDSGVTKRIFGTLISWMQDRPKDKLVYTIMTANDVQSLPPELLRKGRLDEIFWVDLPTHQERLEILNIHLSKRNQLSSSLKKELDVISQLPSLEGFSGAEIENVIENAMFDVFYEDRKIITRKDLEKSISSVVPLSRTRSKEIDDMRQWAVERCKPAQIPDINQVQPKVARRKLNF